ncbi:Phage tail tube protein FII [Vibrio aerogenes CECT 7868]|uniref:Phage tail tube protein FII n=1 Tax=Vibrio aerogenes CECT 7868 TaxID=1216006 RepID=A0A1M6B9N2_9VIBR|nr:phage major tail tube protein [Vibrio aerogenes]SHI45396.1 Phage tail tube protein FII [Vibrio aerogenes CECT 7868]
MAETALMPQTIRAMSLFLGTTTNNRGYAGVVEEVTPPKLTIKTEEFRAGGMDAPLEIDLGMNKLECSFTIANYDPTLFKAYGLVPGEMVTCTLRGAIEENGTTVPVAMTMTGSWKEVDFGSWKSGQKVQMKVAIALKYYKLTIGDTECMEIDVPGMVRKVNGVDKLADMRKAIGLKN